MPEFTSRGNTKEYDNHNWINWTYIKSTDNIFSYTTYMVYFIIERILKFIQLADLSKNPFVVKHYYPKYTKNKFVKPLGFFYQSSIPFYLQWI